MCTKKLFIGFFAAGLLFLTGCEKDKSTTTPVVVVTGNVSNIRSVSQTSVSATVGGDVGLVSGESIGERGVCWSTNQNPTPADNKMVAGTGVGAFSADLTGLTFGAVYYARAYAISAGQTYYGNNIKFLASAPVEIIINGDFKLPDDNVKYLNLNAIPNWKTDDASNDLTGREYDPWRQTGSAYISDWANFYQVVGDVPAEKSTYNIKFDANYIWTDWAPYPPKFYVTFSTFTGDPSTRTPIGTVEIPSIVEYPADATSNWKTYVANFSIPAGSPDAGKQLVIEWSMENYKTESWGWSNTWYNFDNISVMRTLN